MPAWLILSLATALAVASQDAWTKRFFSGRSLYEMTAYPMLYSLPLLAAVLPFVPVPPLDGTFLWCLIVSIPLNGGSFLLYMSAIQRSPLTLTIPYLAFTPVFMILTGLLFLDEMPGPAGVAGILVICIGGYILNIDPRRWTLLSPLKAVLSERGSRMMLLVAFIYSFTSVIGKKGILHSSPLYFNILFFALLNLTLITSLAGLGKIRLDAFRDAPGKGAGVGVLFFLHVVFHGYAISLTQAAYMIAVKRLSVLFSVIYGKLLFGERNITVRFGGAVLMVLGTALILFQGG